jgi:hypothetical protein
VACALFVLSPASSHAEEGRRILVLLENTRTALLPRLGAELASSGFAVDVVSPPSFPLSRQGMEQLARQERASLALVMMEAGAGIELWVLDATTGKSTFREVILSLYDPRDAPDVIAIRVVETFRATLIDLEHAQPAFEADQKPGPVVETPIGVRSPSRFTLAVGGGGAYSTGGVGIMAHLNGSFAWAATPRFSFALDGALTPATTKLRGPEGEADIGWYLAGLSMRFTATDPGALVRLQSGVGAWFAVMHLDGHAAATYSSTPSQFMSVIPHLDLGLRVALTSRLGIAANLSGGASIPGTSIRFADRQVATWGRPLWLAGVAVEAPLD